MLRALIDWALSLLSTSREIAEIRSAVRRLDDRVRDLEEGMRIFSQELRHLRELDASEREKLLLKIEGIVARGQPALRKKRRGKSK